MKIYRVSITSVNGDEGSHGGYSYWPSRKAAEAESRRSIKGGNEVEISAIEVSPSKHGIISALNIHANHPDNG